MIKIVLYTKGLRGLEIFKGLLQKKSLPILCVTEDGDKDINKFCRKLSIPVKCEKKPRSGSHIAYVRGFKPDLIVCAGYSKLIPAEIFKTLKYGAINCHGGRLPQYRGASPIPWQIINGETYGIAYVLKMTEKGIDDGPILAEKRYEILPHDTAKDVTEKVCDIFRDLVPDAVQAYVNGRVPKMRAQKKKGVCHWTRRTPDDGLIKWDRLTVKQVINLIRALDFPYPGAFVVRDQARILIHKARAYRHKLAGVPGRFVGLTEEGAIVLAMDGAVEILEFSLDRKRRPGNLFPARYGETF